MRKRGIALAAVVGLTALGMGGTAVAEPTGSAGRIDREVVQQALDKLTGEGGAAGVQVRITDGRRQFTARSGVAEVGRTEPVPLDGRFRIGSITKTFVSTVVLQLVGEGRVGLDDPVDRYLPGLLPDGDEITVRMLLQHTSGLFNYTRALPLDPAGFEGIRFKHWEPRELVGISTAEPLDFPPGTSWSYSNTNFVVAGLLVEKVTGRPYEVAVNRRILRPLGLRDTSVPGDRVDVPGPHAHGYYSVDGKAVDVTRLNPSVAHAAGEMISTTADLDRFVDALLDGRLLAPAQQAELTRTLPFTEGYGLGFQSTELPCGVTVYGHGGGIPGYTSYLGSTKDTKTRLEGSFTSSPAGGTGAGLEELLNEVFC
ncbi:D-alanyl-D-alanine carboxypeptidase [Saccharothrix tamanrassetensis]|uniref:D-alanyl-D-alanine carboxypeptidase n=1 Tax=Saccharothrix tamanrassetensis TaxID=1051531 RepID=A0A841CW11_9PSEU|nr:serine hydrolase domain-containing protein [Saccharothrix tamanrassetensis]MBB5960318.1 D-alanyl-D-alanine carboxypeptidase [Saccharothrix tamanrassetensis]